MLQWITNLILLQIVSNISCSYYRQHVLTRMLLLASRISEFPPMSTGFSSISNPFASYASTTFGVNPKAAGISLPTGRTFAAASSSADSTGIMDSIKPRPAHSRGEFQLPRKTVPEKLAGPSNSFFMRLQKSSSPSRTASPVRKSVQPIPGERLLANPFGIAQGTPGPGPQHMHNQFSDFLPESSTKRQRTE